VAPAAAVLGAVVLAAGEARRMDGRAKPLIERDGVPLVRRVVQALLAAGVGEVVVVVGHRSDEVAWAVHDLPVLVIVNEDYAAGHVRSLRKGLAALPDAVTAVLVALADQPLLEAADVSAVIDAGERRGPARAVVPRVQQRRGHPVMLDAGACAEILRGNAGYGAREVAGRAPRRGRVARQRQPPLRRRRRLPRGPRAHRAAARLRDALAVVSVRS
jgi:molybdenum cofactor cytidylyltransferase